MTTEFFYKKNGKFYISKNSKKNVKKTDMVNTFTKIKDKQSKEIKANNKELKKLMKLHGTINLEDWIAGGYSGQVDDTYRINNKTAYLNDKYGTYSLSSTTVISGYEGFLQSNFGDDMDCSLMNISTIAKWYSNQSSYPNIPDNINYIYSVVQAKAYLYGYNPNSGLLPIFFDDVARDSFYTWYYYPTATNHYIWSLSGFKSEINATRPFMLTLHNGGYIDHSISVFGYYTYNVSDGQVDFLAVKDNYLTSTRYIDYNLMSVLIIGSWTTIEL